jgi:hypothetical protein
MSHWTHIKIFRLALAFAMTLSASVAPPVHAISHGPATPAPAELERHAALAAGDNGNSHANGRPDEPNPSSAPSTCKVTAPRSTGAPATNVEPWPRSQAMACASSGCCPRWSSMTPIGPGRYRPSVRSLHRMPSGIEHLAGARRAGASLRPAGRRATAERSVGCPARQIQRI